MAPRLALIHINKMTEAGRCQGAEQQQSGGAGDQQRDNGADLVNVSRKTISNTNE
jgi:hypothetical protein